MNSISHQDYLRAGAAGATPETLIMLSRHELPAVRRRVAENPITPSALLTVLSYDFDTDVRIAVGLNKSTPVHVIKQLVFDDSADVRYALSETAYLHKDILQMLSEDDNSYVAHRARRTLAALNSALTVLPAKDWSRKHTFKQLLPNRTFSEVG